mgnify:FL=1
MNAQLIHQKWRVEVTLYASAIMMSLIWSSLGPMMLEITEKFQIPLVKAGLLSGIVACVLGLFASISSMISSRLGMENTASLGVFLMSIGCLMTGLADRYSWVLVGRIIFSIGAGMFFPMLGAIIMEWFDGDELVMINSINFSGTAVGTSIGLAITAPIMHIIGWQETLIIYGIICGIVACFSLFTLIPKRITDSARYSDQSDHEKTKDIYLDVMKRKETWLLAMAFAAPVSLSVITHTFLPAYFVTTKNIGMETAGYYVSSVYLSGIPAAIFGGIIGVKLGSRRPFLIFNGIILGISFLGLLFFEGLGFKICLSFLGVGFLLFTGIFYTIPMELNNMTPRSAGVMLGIITFVGMQFGFTAPIFVGWLELKTGSLLLGLIFYGFFGFMMAICAFLIDESGNKVSSKDGHM